MNFNLIRVVKRAYIEKYKHFLYRIIAIIIAFAITSIIILSIGHNPFEVYNKLIFGPFSTQLKIVQTIKLTITLIVISLGISLAFKMKFWNIGAEGQIIFGAIGATYFALNFSYLPQYILLPIMFMASFIVGGLFGLIPAFFKAKFGTNETLFTLMMNYIAFNIVLFLESGPWKDPASYRNEIIPLAANTRIPSLFSISPWTKLNSGWMIAILLVILVYIYINHTKHGYEISVVGESVNTARYAGMNVGNIIMRTMFISAGICGVAGFIQISGNLETLSHQVAGGLGFTAIITTWLSQLNSFVLVIVAFLFAVMKKGGELVEMLNIPSSASELIQGIILLCILGCEFFLNYKIIFTWPTNKKLLKEKEDKLK